MGWTEIPLRPNGLRLVLTARSAKVVIYGTAGGRLWDGASYRWPFMGQARLERPAVVWPTLPGSRPLPVPGPKVVTYGIEPQTLAAHLPDGVP